MDSIQVAICDASRKTADYYTRLLHHIADKNRLHISISSYSSAEKLLYEISSYPNRFQLIYSNILLGKMDGIQLARHLRKHNCNTEIVFMAPGPEFTFDSFEVNPLTFLDKNLITDAEFEEIFFKAIMNFCSGMNTLYTVKTARSITNIPIKEIEYFQEQNRLITIFFSGKSLFFCDSLDKIAGHLNALNFHFLNPSRSFLVNPAHINCIENGKIILFSGQNIPIHLEKYREIKNEFTNYLIKNR